MGAMSAKCGGCCSLSWSKTAPAGRKESVESKR